VSLCAAILLGDLNYRLSSKVEEVLGLVRDSAEREGDRWKGVYFKKISSEA
jgi:hypothetical protein